MVELYDLLKKCCRLLPRTILTWLQAMQSLDCSFLEFRCEKLKKGKKNLNSFQNNLILEANTRSGNTYKSDII